MYTSHESAINDILEAGKRLYMRGFVAANDGNISARMDDGTVWATPSGVSKGFMQAHELIRVSPEGEVLEGSGKPSSELQLHLAVYNSCPDIAAVVHAHPPASTAFSSAGTAFDLGISTEAVLSLGVVPCAPYALPGSRELAESAAVFARDYNAVLLQSHGSVAWGENAISALYRLESLEHSIITWQYMHSLGTSRLLSQQQIAGLVELRKSFRITRGGTPKGS